MEAAKALDSEEDKEKEKKGRRKKKGTTEGEVSAEEGDGERKKRRKGKLKKRGTPGADDGLEEEPLFSGGEDAEESKPKKVGKLSCMDQIVSETSSQRAGQKRVVRDDDDEEVAVSSRPHKKQ